MTKRYGIEWQSEYGDVDIELYCFKIRHSIENGGLGRYGHFKNIVHLLWPKYVWTPWSEPKFRSLCDNHFVTWSGPASSGKSTDAALYGLVFWLSSPKDTIVIQTSTTIPMLRRLIWGQTKKFFYSAPAPGLPGNMVDSRNVLQSLKGDDKHAMFGIAVKQGSVSEAVGRIIGLHANHMLIQVDECTDVPEAIFDACSNLQKGCSDFNFLGIGNANSRFDLHGKLSEPKDGWSSVSVEDEQWETKLGVCIHFDGSKLNNSGQWPFLISNKDVDHAEKNEGSGSPKYWRFTRGFWCPEGVIKSVFSEAMLIRFRAKEKHNWLSGFNVLAGLDPAFEGGDRCMFMTAKYGEIEGGKFGLELSEAITIKPNLALSEPVHYQIAHQVIDLCKARGIDPQNFAIDSTGEGGGLSDIISEKWSRKIHRVEFGGSASDRPVSAERNVPAKEEYVNKVTELWFSARQFLQSEQLKGISDDVAVEFCCRLYEYRGNRVQVEPKGEMKARIGRSPDLADSAVILVDLVRSKGTYPGGSRKSQDTEDQEWLDKAIELDVASDEQNYLVNDF